MGKQCQSCGMPLQTKKAGDCRGTETDGSKSEKWCSLCYETERLLCQTAHLRKCSKL